MKRLLDNPIGLVLMAVVVIKALDVVRAIAESRK